jgi:hypothetical protein
MKIIQIPDVLHQYLIHVLETHASRGIHPDEGLAVNRLWEAVTVHVTTISDAEIEKAAKPEPPSASYGVPTSGDIRRGIPECDICFEEDRSYTCVRPGHGFGNRAAKQEQESKPAMQGTGPR